MSSEVYHPLEEVDDFQFEAFLKRARELASGGDPYRAAFELGRVLGIIQSIMNRRGDEIPAEQPVGEKMIGEFVWYYRDIAKTVDDLPIFEAIAVAGMTAALAAYRLPKPAAHNVGRWARTERDLLLEGDEDARQRARELHGDAVFNIPPGFGNDRERMSMVESVEMQALMKNWAERANNEGWIPPY